MIRQEFDLQAGALYLRLAEGDLKCTESVDEVPCGDGRANVDLGYHGVVLGIEVLTPGQPWPLLAILVRYDISNEDAEELLTGYPFPPPEVSAATPVPSEPDLGTLSTREQLDAAWDAATEPQRRRLLRQIGEAQDRGRARGGLVCCGTTGADHEPWCTSPMPMAVTEAQRAEAAACVAGLGQAGGDRA